MSKEREAFESWFESRYGAHFMQFALDLDFYVDKHTQTCWEAWQAAKAQAVPEGVVLVPKEPTQEMLDSARDWSTKKYGKAVGNDGAYGCYRAMVSSCEP